jgi:hypothetical protein
MGACVGRGSVVGLGVGTGGEVDGDGDGVTVWTDGPVLVVSPVRSVVVRGYIIAITAKATAAASASGTQLLKEEGRRGPTGSLGSRRGSRGFSYVMGFSGPFPANSPRTDKVPGRRKEARVRPAPIRQTRAATAARLALWLRTGSPARPTRRQPVGHRVHAQRDRPAHGQRCTGSSRTDGHHRYRRSIETHWGALMTRMICPMNGMRWC